MRTSLRNRLITLSLLSACSVGSAYGDEWTAPSFARGSRSGDLESSERDPDSGAYIGVGYGQVTNRYHDLESPRRSSAYKVFAGYAYNKNFATELAYLHIGSDDGYHMDSVRLSSHSYVGSVVGRLPLGDYLSLMAKIGYAAFDTTLQSLNSAGDSGTTGDFAVGVVVAVDLGKHFAIRTEYEAVGFSHVVYDIATLSGVFKF